MFDILFFDRIHGAGRLTGNNETWFPDKHLGQCDPVPLSVRKLAREPVQDLPGFLFGKSCHHNGDNCFLLCELFGEPGADRIGQVIDDAAVRKQVKVSNGQ